MDANDPLREFLANTGWSCDDLLAKLQKLKTVQDSNSSTIKQNNIQQASNSQECVVDSTGDVDGDDVISTINLSRKTNTKNKNNDFSDTDEDEAEVLVTNSNIIDEIIEDISINEHDDTSSTEKPISSTEEALNEAAEIKEVKIIELDQEVDDKFEDECNEISRITLEKMEEFEKLSRELTTETLKDTSEISCTATENNLPNSRMLISPITNNRITHFQGKISTETQASDISVLEPTTDTLKFDHGVHKVLFELNDNTNYDEKFESEKNNDEQIIDISTTEFPLKKYPDTESINCSENSITLEEKNAINNQEFKTCTEKEEHFNCETEINKSTHSILDTLVNSKKIPGTENLESNNPTSENNIAQCPEIIIDLNLSAEFQSTTEQESKDDLSQDNILLNGTYTSDNVNAIEKEGTSPTIPDDISNHLKIQLSCLRTRKKEISFGRLLENVDLNKKSDKLLSFPLCAKTGLIETAKTNKIISEDLTVSKENTASDTMPHSNNREQVEQPMSKIISQSESAQGSDLFLHGDNDELYTQTNELGFVILNVQGGIEFDSNENENIPHNSKTYYGNTKSPNHVQEIEEKMETSGVFDEIRKIIRKEKINTSQNDSSENKKTADKDSSFISSTDISQSSFNMEESNQNTDINSPFISNTLDEFLTENSKLNISYNVPKCIAEDGLKDGVDHSPLLLKKVVGIKQKGDVTRKNVKTIKAKTLAQKRKILERQQQELLKKIGKDIISTKNLKIVDRDFVMFEDKKVWVKTTSSNGKCVGVIDCVNKYAQESLKIDSKRKLSLLGDSKQQKVKYLPGPLCKKPSLQLTGNTEWETLHKTLPKLFIEIFPVSGKPPPPHIVHHFSNNTYSLSNERIEFALSALKTKSRDMTNEKIFFPVNYWNNQEQIVVRKKKITECIPLNISNECQAVDSSADVINNVIEGLLNYVETKELAHTIVKDDISRRAGEDKDRSSNEQASNSRKRQKKNRIDLELQRLNCKIVNVELEEKEKINCEKPFCKLGCVCKSLECDKILNLHCRKYQCMFNCSCPKEKNVVFDNNLALPSGTDILSTEAVDRIEGEAKKHLAKVERDFTQTVIHANDKTYLVGLGTRCKTRRCTKTPIKYSDFVEGLDDYENNKKRIFMDCHVVSLIKLNIPQMIPFCWAHNEYDCFCKGKCRVVKKVGDQTKQVTDIKSIKKQKTNELTKDGSKSVNRRLTTTENGSASVEPEFFPGSGRPIRTLKKPKLDENFEYEPTSIHLPEMTCARINEVNSKYKQSRKIHQKYLRNDFMYNIKESDMLKYKLFTSNEIKETVEADLLKWHLIKESINRQQISDKMVPHKRKQIFKVRNESAKKTKYSIIDGAMQRRKKVVTAVRNDDDREPLFDGEIIIDENNMELLTRMGPRQVADGYARLLPWTNLVQSFNEGKINVWCMKDQPTKLMMNKAECNNIPTNFVHIKDSQQKTLVMSCILDNQLPPGYTHDNVSFILKKNKDHFEICGLCAKNNPIEDQELATFNKNNYQEVDTNFVHKDIHGTQRTLFMRKQKFNLQKLMMENTKDLENSLEKDKVFSCYALPEIYRVCKWRIIYLNSDFSFLVFKKINYSVKYTDLLSAGATAKRTELTVMLRNIEMQNHYDHKNFGIYFDPQFQDRLFIGPYFAQYNENDVETYRYINGKLVGTESFSKMRGEVNFKCGHWLIERQFKGTQTIDLTKEEDVQPANRKIGKIFLHNNKEVKVIDAIPKTPTEFNRYIITNIPHFGYLGAYQHLNSEIDIQWPFEKKLLRFSDTKTAVDYLQTRFSSLLISVPESFKLSVLLLTSVDFENTPPIRCEVLNGSHTTLVANLRFVATKIIKRINVNSKQRSIYQRSEYDAVVRLCKLINSNDNGETSVHNGNISVEHICGTFGFYSISDITDENSVEKTGFTKSDINLAIMIKRQRFFKDKAQQLASLVGMPPNFTIDDLAQQTTAVIKNLQESNKELLTEKSQLTLEKRSKAGNAFVLISQLSPNRRYIESKKLMSIMKTTEPIEIIDSDEEKDEQQKEAINPANVPSTSTTKQQSLLKPLVRIPVSQKKSLLVRGDVTDPGITKMNAQYIPGVKLVRNSFGKLVLVADNSPPKKSAITPGTKILIKNSKIQSVTQINPESNQHSCAVSDNSTDCLKTEDPLIIDLCSEQSLTDQKSTDHD